MRPCLALALLLASAAAAQTEATNYPAARFTDAGRKAKLLAAAADIDAAFEKYAKAQNIPGMVWGLVIDGELAHVRSTGVRDLTAKDAVTAETVFRIASMTKSFTALAILKLRDAGKLSLEDPVSRFIPEFAKMALPTSDAGPVRIRHLLTHGAGFPEDNPWGDQQLGATDADLAAWLKKGIPFSTAPGSAYEYSNYGFGLLGRIVTKASGTDYRKYVEKEILAPLGMSSSSLEYTAIPAARRATGYRRKPDGAFEEEKPLPHGAFGSMGGLLTSATDLARYVAFHLSAWPARDEADHGPVARASVREMNQLWRPSALTAARGKAQFSGYGYGLRISSDCRFAHIVGHGGGLPGFGSYMAWLPEFGVGMFAMANKTYSGPSGPINESWDLLLPTGALRPRELPVSPLLSSMRDSIVKVWRNADMRELHRVAAMNLFLDVPEAQRSNELAQARTEAGACSSIGDVRPENWLRGVFDMTCEKGPVRVNFTLTPTQPPALQYLSFRRRNPDEPAITAAPTSGLNGSFCRE
ncbi:MAG: serine hydrolase domain-containing protein [Bryobacteraceae bacterium]|nr:serine hydrolase domain-containing protein [Bryobacteraceae bacterium]